MKVPQRAKDDLLKTLQEKYAFAKIEIK